MPLPLSVAIVCRNNAATIGRTLESVAGLASEIVAIDSGSTDETLAILAGHNARITQTPWRGHVATKQLALEACTQSWILSLDSDESLTAPLREAIERDLPRASANTAGYILNRKVWYQGRPLNYAWQPEERLRLVRRGAAKWTGLDPHDQLELFTGASGQVGMIPGDLRHDSIGTFADFLAKQAAHSRTMAASLHAEGRPGRLWRLVTSPPGAFLKQLILKQAWRDGWPGWLAAASTGAAALMKHACLIELERSDPRTPPAH